MDTFIIKLSIPEEPHDATTMLIAADFHIPYHNVREPLTFRLTTLSSSQRKIKSENANKLPT
jgi:hypothetical protein